MLRGSKEREVSPMIVLFEVTVLRKGLVRLTTEQLSAIMSSVMEMMQVLEAL
jgi:hypothetical protein